MGKKSELGQFLTKNKDYILKNMIVDMPQDTCKNIFVDPFAGEKDLLKWISRSCRRKGMTVEAYDIDPKIEGVEHRNSFLNPPIIKGKYIITNPPYLAKNKTKNKEVFEAYDTDDLYKSALKMLMGWDINSKEYNKDNSCEGGIIIVPLNFFSDRDWKLRRDFLSRYKVICLNVFEEQVFSDTSYIVCAFNFRKFLYNGEEQVFRIRFYPDYLINDEAQKQGHHLRRTLSEYNQYTIGYEFKKLIKNKSDKIKVGRLVDYKKIEENWYISKLFLRAVDTGSNDGRIKLSIKEEPFYGKISERTHATIIFSQVIEKEKEKIIVKKFNEILEY